MIDSTNPRQLADNIRKLWDKFRSISGDLLPSRSTATTGQILKLTGETKTPAWADEYSYTPPAYSEMEVNTGQKWIDGKDIYMISVTGTLPEIEQTTNRTEIATLATNLNILGVYTSVTSPTVGSIAFNRFVAQYVIETGIVSLLSVTTPFSEGPYNATIYYTKPDPAPETRDDDTLEEPETPEEPEVKETKTRKKTTK